MNTNMTGFKLFSKDCVFVLWMKVGSALEGLTYLYMAIILTGVVWTSDTFKDNLQIKINFI